MTITAKRKAFLEIAEQIAACAWGQKNMTNDASFMQCFNCTRDQALENNIKVFYEKFSNIV